MEIDSDTVRERKQLAYEGTIAVVVTVDRETGELEGEAKIVARGVRGLSSGNGLGGSNGNYLLEDAKRVVAAAVAGASRQTLSDETLLKEHVRVELKRFIQKQTGARPVITPVIVLI
jgi:ribonuclease J